MYVEAADTCGAPCSVWRRSATKPRDSSLSRGTTSQPLHPLGLAVAATSRRRPLRMRTARTTLTADIDVRPFVALPSPLPRRPLPPTAAPFAHGVLSRFLVRSYANDAHCPSTVAHPPAVRMRRQYNRRSPIGWFNDLIRDERRRTNEREATDAENREYRFGKKKRRAIYICCLFLLPVFS